MSQFKLRLQNIFKEIYPNDNKNDASSLQTNLNELSMFNNKNIPIQNNNNNNDASFLNNTNSTITNTTLLNKSPSMKKIREMSTQFGIECKRDNNNNIDKSFFNESSLNNSFYSINMNNKGNNRRNSFNGKTLLHNNDYGIKRSSSLKDILITTGTRSNYTPRSNSKIMKNISYIKQDIEGNSSNNGQEICSFLKKHITNDNNKNNKGNYTKENKRSYSGIKYNNVHSNLSSNQKNYNLYTNNKYLMNNHNRTARKINQAYTYITGIPRVPSKPKTNNAKREFIFI
jgi:hypothetical protein